MPEVIDLFRVAADAGATVHESVVEVAAVSSGPARDALSSVVRRTSRGERLTTALSQLLDDLGEPARPLVAALVSCERDGAALRVPLERAANLARDVRRRDAEVEARRVPVRLLLPLVACVLPAFTLLTVVPLLAGTLRSLGI
jgi:tight adherence protein C